jgi:uncharacterized protein (DUF1697 family)
MGELKKCFESLGHTEVITYINSGNVIFVSDNTDTKQLSSELEARIEKNFGFFVDVLVVDGATFIEVIETAPSGFGNEPELYHYDVIFLLDGVPQEVAAEFEINPEVDAVWPGKTVVYYSRLSEKRTKSRLSKIMVKPLYKRMTIRNWNTTKKLAAMLKDA